MIVGTPAALTRDVNATGDAKIVHNSSAATPCMTTMAFLGSFFSDTLEIQPENGRTPSLATAQISRELATPATVALKMRPKMQMTFTKRKGESVFVSARCDPGREIARRGSPCQTEATAAVEQQSNPCTDFPLDTSHPLLDLLKICPPLPMLSAYMLTNGCGASRP